MQKPKQLDNPNLEELRAACQEYLDFMESDEYNCDREEDYEYAVLETAMRTIFGKDVYAWINEMMDIKDV